MFFLKCCDFSELCQFCCSAGVLPAWCVYTHWHRGKTEKGQSPEYFQILRKNTIFNEHPVSVYPSSHLFAYRSIYIISILKTINVTIDCCYLLIHWSIYFHSPVWQDCRGKQVPCPWTYSRPWYKEHHHTIKKIMNIVSVIIMVMMIMIVIMIIIMIIII